jgi:hypothetical protein
MKTDLNSLLKIVLGNYQQILEVLGENNITIAQFIGLVIGLYGIWEKIKSEEEPEPKPEPPPDPIVDPIVDPIYDPIVAFDGNTIADEMRKKFNVGWRDTVCWFALFSTYGDHPWDEGVSKGDAEAEEAWSMKEKFAPWFTSKINNVISQLNKNKSFKVLVISNDGVDKGGCFMVEPIVAQLTNGGISTERIVRGDILYY